MLSDNQKGKKSHMVVIFHHYFYIYMNKSHFLPQYKITKPDNSFLLFLKASLMKYFHMLSRLFQREQLLVSTFES